MLARQGVEDAVSDKPGVWITGVKHTNVELAATCSVKLWLSLSLSRYFQIQT